MITFSRHILIVLFLLSGLAHEVWAQRLFAVNSSWGGSYLVAIDPSSGEVTYIGDTGILCDAMAFGPYGQLFGADTSAHRWGRLSILDPTTGALEERVGAFTNRGVLTSLAFHPQSGLLYGVEINDENLVTVDVLTGALSIVGHLNDPRQITGLAWSPDGSTLYAIDLWACLYVIDHLSGQASLVGCDNSRVPLGLAIDPVTGILYAADYEEDADAVISRVDANTGIHTDVWTVPGTRLVTGLSFEVFGPGVGYCMTNVNSTGSSAAIAAYGANSWAESNLILRSFPVPNQVGVFFHGSGQQSTPFGNGTLCVSGSIVRGEPILAERNSARFTYDGSQPERDLAPYVGSNRNFQYWFRDPMGGGAQFNTSSAISIDILP